MMVQIHVNLAQRIANVLTDPRTIGPCGEVVQILGELQAQVETSKKAQAQVAAKANAQAAAEAKARAAAETLLSAGNNGKAAQA